MGFAPAWQRKAAARSSRVVAPGAARSWPSKGAKMPGKPRPAREPRAEEGGHAPAGKVNATEQGKPDQRLGRSRRLTRSIHFQEAYNQGRRWVGRLMVLWLRTGEGAALRLGVVAGRKVGGAVARSRAKRLLREAYRRERHRLSGDVDVVLVARRAIVNASWDEVTEELNRLSEQAGLTDAEE